MSGERGGGDVDGRRGRGEKERDEISKQELRHLSCTSIFFRGSTVTVRRSTVTERGRSIWPVSSSFSSTTSSFFLQSISSYVSVISFCYRRPPFTLFILVLSIFLVLHYLLHFLLLFARSTCLSLHLLFYLHFLPE